MVMWRTTGMEYSEKVLEGGKSEERLSEYERAGEP